jgi:hypothetical protein
MKNPAGEFYRSHCGLDCYRLFKFTHIDYEMQTFVSINIIVTQCIVQYQLELSTFHEEIYFITIRSNDFVTTRKIVKR